MTIGNLGSYQLLTRCAKVMGGPGVLVASLILGGVVTGFTIRGAIEEERKRQDRIKSLHFCVDSESAYQEVD